MQIFPILQKYSHIRGTIAIDKDINQLARKQDLVHLAILLVLALGIGIYLIITTTLIAKDGMSYINYAKGLAISPLKIMRDSSGYAQRLYTPGYPFLILMIHKLVDLFGYGTTGLSWIYSAQTASLLCRVPALIPLYFIGKELVGGKLSFWAMFVLVILPYSARFGSDAIRAWPHILFLATGFLFLIWGAKYEKWWMFGIAGLVAGMGYTVRPMCAQLIMYGVVWLTYCLLNRRHKCNTSRANLVGGLALLIIGFAVVVVPYMKVRGEILPDRLQQIIKYFSLNSGENNIEQPVIFHPVNLGYTAGLSIRKDNVAKALTILISRISDHLMYYFVPALFIGMYYYFRRNPRNEAMFFVTIFFLTNVGMVILRYCIHPDLSKRYILPLVVITIFFVPIGLQILAIKIGGMFCKTIYKKNISEEESRRWFFILLVIGIVICLPKLLRPLRIEKKGYRLAAKWLKKNTAKEDVIVTPDKRITFYAERKGIEFKSDNASIIPVDAGYVIKIIKRKRHEKLKFAKTSQYNADEKEDNNKNDAFLSEMKKNCSLKGLVGYWSANDDTLDYSIYHNHARTHGGLGYMTSKYGQAFNFTSNINGYVDCGNNSSLNPTNSVTVSAWIYPVTNSRGSVVTKNGPYFIEICADSKIRAGVYAGSPPLWTYAIGTSALSLHTWHHVVLTYNGSYIKIYVDGKIDGTPVVKSGDMAIEQSSVYIGYGLPGLDHYFKGLIDEIMLFNTALQLDEIKALNKMVESKTVPTFESDINAYPIFDCWKVKRKYSLWVDERKKKKKLCIYKIQ